MDRRRFLESMVTVTGATMAGLSWIGVDAQTVGSASRLAHDPRRPQYHLLPKHGWINDPNGPIYWKGRYHMFFQFNPRVVGFGDLSMDWGHAVSPDMIHWQHLPIALAPTPGGPDRDGCWTGTAVVDGNQVAILYTGVVKVGNGQFRQSQCLATSTDPDLNVWKKWPQAVIAAPPEGMQVTGFRDPSPWRGKNAWYTVVGSGIANRGGQVLLYRSADLRQWQYLNPLVTEWEPGVPGEGGDMWECPDLFPLEGRHVLICSSNGKVRWRVGSLDEGAMRFHPEKVGVVDEGAYYAAKSQRDAAGRRILWGWVEETRPQAAYEAAGWAGMMSLPRVLTLDAAGGLRVAPAPGVAELRRGERSIGPGPKAADELARLKISAATGEIQGTVMMARQPWSLRMLGLLPGGAMDAPIATISYDPARQSGIVVNGSFLEVPGLAKKSCSTLDVDFYVDGSVAELFFGNAAAYTARFYYPGSTAPDVYLDLQGPASVLGRFKRWRMTPISLDRLAT